MTVRKAGLYPDRGAGEANVRLENGAVHELQRGSKE